MLKFKSKDLAYHDKRQMIYTLVWLENDEGAKYPVYFPKEDIDKPNAELYEAAMEIIYQEIFPQRAENEKFGIIEGKIAEIDQATSRSKEQYDKVEQMMQLTTSMVNELIVSLMDGEDNETTN